MEEPYYTKSTKLTQSMTTVNLAVVGDYITSGMRKSTSLDLKQPNDKSYHLNVVERDKAPAE